MAGVMRRFPVVGHRILMSSIDRNESSGNGESLVDVMFGFYDDGSSANYSTNYSDDDDDGGDENEVGDSTNAAENKAFWDGQHRLLEQTLSRSSSLESRIRKATKEALNSTQSSQTICICNRPVAGRCRNCLMSNISEHLRNAGYNSAICKSKWKSSLDIPSGEHTCIDVVENSSSQKEVRVVIDLNFRVEFEMARGNNEYNLLISKLPEIFVGKAEKLRILIKIICSAAKKCMKERNMHLGPWRKYRYVQAKWFGTCKRTMPTPLIPEGFNNRMQRPKASMLTFDLLEKLPNLQCTAVEVL